MNEAGREQAALIAERISKISFDALVASPFTRARETAEMIAKKTNKSPEYSELFVERIKPTSINGKPYSDEAANVIWRQWETSLYTTGMRVEDSENFEDLVRRADEALSYLCDRQESAIVVVTHGFFLRTIVARVLLKDMLTPESYQSIQRSADMQNTGITVLRYQESFEQDASWRLWTYNDHAHLG